MTIQCGICLDYHLPGAHCHSCGSIAIGRKFYNIHNGREVVRGIARPVHHMIDNVVSLAKVTPDAQPTLVRQ